MASSFHGNFIRFLNIMGIHGIPRGIPVPGTGRPAPLRRCCTSAPPSWDFSPCPSCRGWAEREGVATKPPRKLVDFFGDVFFADLDIWRIYFKGFSGMKSAILDGRLIFWRQKGLTLSIMKIWIRISKREQILPKIDMIFVGQICGQGPTHLDTLSLCIQASFALFHHHCTYSFILCSWPITKLPSGGRRERFSAMGIEISQEKLEPVGATIRASQPYNRWYYIISNHIPIVSRILIINSAMISFHHLEVWFFLGAMGGVPHWHPPHRLWSCVSDGTGRSSAGGSSYDNPDEMGDLLGGSSQQVSNPSYNPLKTMGSCHKMGTF